jgi:polysaccharide chain length determinant protein (PEP-CTERM system associated)
MPKSIPFLDYLNAIIHYRLVALCAFAIGAVIVAWTVLTLPDVYESTTLIMVEPQEVPQNYVKATVTTRIEERLNALNQEVLSRTRLEAIIRDLDLFRDMRDKETPSERIVEAMRRKIRVQVFSRDNAFRISYEADNPTVAQQVTARVAGLYIDENLRIREERVSGTTDFLENELAKVKNQLEKQEAAIQAFKQRHMGELPEQRETNMRALEGQRMELQTVTLALSAATERKLLIERQIAQAQVPVQSVGGPAVAADPRSQLAALVTKLQELRSRYTTQHPDVTALERQIERARAQLGLEADGAEGSGGARALVPSDLARARNEVYVEIARLQAQKQEIEKRIEMYEARVENAFVREQELLLLTRDYSVTKTKYQTMLDKKLEAQLSQSLERRQKGERFRILDPASRPEAPVRPNRQMLLLLGLAGSLGIALALPILLWYLDTSFHVADDLAAYSLPVLAVIPQLATADILRRRRFYRLRVLGLSAAALVIGLGTASFYSRYLF